MEELAGYIAQQCELTFATDVDDPLPRLEQMQGALAQFLSGDSRCLVAYLRADPWPAGPTDEEKYHKARCLLQPSNAIRYIPPRVLANPEF